jgi:hypothetical protein
LVFFVSSRLRAFVVAFNSIKTISAASAASALNVILFTSPLALGFPFLANFLCLGDNGLAAA